MSKEKLASFIDHTQLRPNTTAIDIEQLCSEAVEHQFYAVCVNSSWLPLAASYLKGSPVKLAATAGFPLGACSTKVKAYETEYALAQGADEIDFVLNMGWLKQGKHKEVLHEFRELRKTAPNAVLKVILETCLLNDDEKRAACEMALEAKLDFVKTSTGFSTAGATLEDVKLMKSIVHDQAQVKASGGIRDAKTAQAFIQAGASRLGTSSGVAIVLAESFV